MASFTATRLILLLLILAQFGQPISSTTLTLKSSHSHLNLNQILNSNFDRSEVRLSFKYKPLNRRFALVSGILGLQSGDGEPGDRESVERESGHRKSGYKESSDRESGYKESGHRELSDRELDHSEPGHKEQDNSELGEPLKFVLIVNSDERLELIVNRPNKASGENLVSIYLVQETNQTQMFPREQIDFFRYGPGEESDSKRFQGKQYRRSEKKFIREADQVDQEKKDNWRILGVTINRKQFKIAHSLYADCRLNDRHQSNCRQSSLTYRLADDWPVNEPVKSQQRSEKNEPSERPTQPKDRTTSRFMELNQLLIGKEWSESDSYQVHLVNRSDFPGASDLKQLNETEDQHSKSQIHNNFLQSSIPNFQTSNQEQFSGLIGCLNAIELNEHYLDFSSDSSTDSSSDFSSDFASDSSLPTNQINELNNKVNEPNPADSAQHSADQIAQIDKQIKTEPLAGGGRLVAASKATVEKDRNDAKDSRAEKYLSGVRSVSQNADDVRIVKNVNTSREQLLELEDSDWWKVANSNAVLVGQIERNICNRSDPCANYCLHGAACMLNEQNGQPICHCDLVGYTGERCFFRKFIFRSIYL